MLDKAINSIVSPVKVDTGFCVSTVHYAARALTALASSCLLVNSSCNCSISAFMVVSPPLKSWPSAYRGRM